MSTVADFKRRTAVVIQGPLQSRGRTAATRNVAIDKVVASDVVDFACSRNISDIFARHAADFGSMVCVTWTSEDASELRSLVGDSSVIQIDDTTKQLPARSQFIPVNNKLRQFRSTLAGLEASQDRGLDFAIKVRTDQYVDLDRVSEFLAELERSGKLKERLFTPAFKRGMSFGIEDFYLAARFRVLRDACEVFLGYGEADFSQSVHTDLFGKLAWAFCGKSLALPLTAYFMRNSWGARTPDQAELMIHAWREFFGVFPRDVWESTRWRGEPLGNEPSNLYAEDESDAIPRELMNIKNRIANQASTALRRGFLNYVHTDWERLMVFVYGETKRGRGRRLNRVGSLLMSLVKR